MPNRIGSAVYTFFRGLCCCCISNPEIHDLPPVAPNHGLLDTTITAPSGVISDTCTPPMSEKFSDSGSSGSIGVRDSGAAPPPEVTEAGYQDIQPQTSERGSVRDAPLSSDSLPLVNSVGNQSLPVKSDRLPRKVVTDGREVADGPRAAAYVAEHKLPGIEDKPPQATEQSEAAADESENGSHAHTTSSAHGPPEEDGPSQQAVEQKLPRKKAESVQANDRSRAAHVGERLPRRKTLVEAEGKTEDGIRPPDDKLPRMKV